MHAWFKICQKACGNCLHAWFHSLKQDIKCEWKMVVILEDGSYFSLGIKNCYCI